MDWFYILVAWGHVVAATLWIGGMLFLSLVFVPVLKAESHQVVVQSFFRSVAQRFRIFARWAMVLLILTGLVLLDQRMILSLPLNTWSAALFAKLGLVFLLIGVSPIHEMLLGPRVGSIKEIPEHVRTTNQQRLLRISPWISRLTALLGLSVLYVATILARE